MKIRHEINLINGTLVASGNVFRTSADERVYVDFSKYSGTLTTYLEVVYTNTILTGSCSVSLFDHLSSTGHGSLPNLSNNVTSYTLYRNINASATNGETGVREYSLAVGTSGSGAGTVTIKSARLVIIQNVGTDPMIRSETRIEIGNRETGKTNTTTQPLSTPKYFRFNSADWDGDIEIIAEATYAISSDMTTCRVWLQTSNDLTTWSNTALIVNGGTSTTAVRVKSSNLTSLITDGMYVRIATDIASSMFTHSVYNAALIIRQSSYTSALAQTTSTSSSFLGNLRVGFGQSFTTVGALSVVAIGIPVSISSGNPTVPVVVKIYSDSAFTSLVATSYSYIGSQLPSSGVFKFPFASPVSLSAGTVYYLAIIFDGTVDTSNFYVISTANTNPYSGGSMYYTNNGTSWTNETASDMYFVLYEEGAGIEKLEEQFLLGNAPAFSGTAAQKFLTKYDPAEFDGVDVGFIHQVDASNDSTNVLQLETEAGTLLTGSIVKSPDNVDFGRGYYSTGAGGNAIGTDLNNNSGKGQAFLATGNKILGGSFHLQKSGSPTGTIYFRLYAGTGTLGTNANVSGSALAEATVDASTLPTSTGEIKFFFSSAVDVTDGGLYVLTCEFVTSNDSNHIVIAQTSDTTGNAVSQNKTTSAWTSTSVDYAMSVRFGTIMPVSSGNIDVKPTTNSGSIFASRILARIIKDAGGTGYVLTAASGSFSFTGNATTLKVSRKLVAAAVAFALTGNVATLSKSKNMPAVTGTYSQVGYTAALMVSRSLPTTTGSYLLNGNTANLKYGRKLTAAIGTYSFTGIAAAPKRGFKATASSGTFALTGNQAFLINARKLTAAVSTYALSGGAALFIKGYRMQAASTAYTFSGVAAAPKYGRKTGFSTGTFNLSGSATGIYYGKKLTAQTGVFTVTGSYAALNYLLRPGSFSATGNAANLLAGRKTAAGTGSYALTCLDASIIGGKSMAADVAVFVVSGSNASLVHDKSITGTTGSYVLTGYGTSPIATRITTTSSGSFAFVGSDTRVLHGRKIAASAGNYILTGNAINTPYGYRIPLISGVFSLSGTNTSLSRGLALLASNGFFGLSGGSTGLTVSRNILIDPGQYLLTGNDASLSSTDNQGMAADSGTFLLTGSTTNLSLTRHLSLTSGSFVFSGNASVLAKNYRLSASVGSILLTGHTTGLLRSYQLSTSSGGYLLSGQALLFVSRVLPSGAGVFVWSGFDAGLSYEENQNSLPGGPGVFSVSASGANFLLGRIMISTPAAFSLSGQAAIIIIGPYELEVLCLRSNILTTSLALNSKIDNIVLDSGVQLSIEGVSGAIEQQITAPSGINTVIAAGSNIFTVIQLSSIIKSDTNECF